MPKDFILYALFGGHFFKVTGDRYCHKVAQKNEVERLFPLIYFQWLTS